MDLRELRLEIDKIDDELVRLFVQRMDVSARIADYKKENGLPIFVPVREQEKLKDVAQKAGPEMEVYTRVLYSMLFELSRGYQSQRNATGTPLSESIRLAISDTPRLLPKDAAVACLGSQDPDGAMVCRKLFGEHQLMDFVNAEAVLSAVRQGLCRYGVLPLQNDMKKVYDLLSEQRLFIVRSYRLTDQKRYICVSQNLEIYPGADRTSIRMALSDDPGALYKVLARLSTLGINVSRVESRPIAERHFHAMFYFDLNTSVYADEFVQLICELDDLCQEFAYLGSYNEVI